MGNAVPHPVLTDRFAQAFAFASVVHASQTRKGTATPYLSHLMGVASLVLEHGADEDLDLDRGLLCECVQVGGERQQQGKCETHGVSSGSEV